MAFLVDLGQTMQAYLVPCCGSVGGCGARAVSRKTPIYFMLYNISILPLSLLLFNVTITKRAFRRITHFLQIWSQPFQVSGTSYQRNLDRHQLHISWMIFSFSGKTLVPVKFGPLLLFFFITSSLPGCLLIFLAIQ